MANTKFQLKRSVVPGKIPLSTDLDIGELALNLSDQKGYTKHSTGNVIVLFDYLEANSAYLIAKTSYDSSNNALATAQSAFAAANVSISVNTTQNTSITAIQGVDATQNTNITSAFAQANTALIAAQGAFGTANNAVNVNATQNTNITSAFTQANTALIAAQGAFTQANNAVNVNATQNTSISAIQGVDATQNTNITSAFTQANTANINASNATFLTTGTVNTARLGSGTANANTYLAGDNTWKPISTQVRQSFYAATNQTSFVITGGYTANNIDVFLNGVKLLNGTDVIVSSGNTIVLSVPANYNDVLDVSGSTLPLAIANVVRKTGDTMTGTLVVPEINMTSGTITASTVTVNTTTANQVIDLFSTSVFRSVKYLVQITSGTWHQVSEILLTHNGTDSYLTEYGLVATETILGSFDTDILSGNTRLLFSAVNATNTLRIVRTSIIN